MAGIRQKKVLPLVVDTDVVVYSYHGCFVCHALLPKTAWHVEKWERREGRRCRRSRCFRVFTSYLGSFRTKDHLTTVRSLLHKRNQASVLSFSRCRECIVRVAPSLLNGHSNGLRVCRWSESTCGLGKRNCTVHKYRHSKRFNKLSRGMAIQFFRGKTDTRSS